MFKKNMVYDMPLCMIWAIPNKCQVPFWGSFWPVGAPYEGTHRFGSPRYLPWASSVKKCVTGVTSKFGIAHIQSWHPKIFPLGGVCSEPSFYITIYNKFVMDADLERYQQSQRCTLRKSGLGNDKVENSIILFRCTFTQKFLFRISTLASWIPFKML